MNTAVSNNNSNELAQLINNFPKDALKNWAWIPVTAISIKFIFDSIMAKDYELYGDVKEGKFALCKHREQFVE